MDIPVGIRRNFCPDQFILIYDLSKAQMLYGLTYMNKGKWLGKYSHGASSLKPPSIPVEPETRTFGYFPRNTDCYINRDPGSLEWFMK